MSAKRVAVVSIAVLGLVGAGSAAAARPPVKPAFKTHLAKVARTTQVGQGSIFAAVMTYLQLDTNTLFGKLKSGQTLAQLAVAQGKTPQGLIDAVAAAAKAQLDRRVAAGKLDAAKETTILAQLRLQLATLVNKPFGARTHVPNVPTFATPYLKPVLDYLQIDATTLVQELRTGKSLAGIAVAHGKTAAGLTAAIVAPLEAKLDAAVSAGTLTTAQRDALVARLRTGLARLVAGTSTS
jgi:hypothetical protein